MNFIQHNYELYKRRLTKIPLLKGSERVHTWTHPSGAPNFGDDIFREIVMKLDPDWLHEKGEGTLYPGGSVLHLLNEGDCAWGIGLNNPRFHFYKKFPRNVCLLGVRGPITKAFLESCLGINDIPVIGDSALLLPELFPDLKRINKTFKLGVVKHFNDNSSVDCDYLEIDPLRPAMEVIKDILSCESIISSSLHGIIVAESFGIPAVWYRPVEFKEPVFKFYDYYLQTSRMPTSKPDIQLAVDYLKFWDPPKINTAPLLATFPKYFNSISDKGI